MVKSLCLNCGIKAAKGFLVYMFSYSVNFLPLILANKYSHSLRDVNELHICFHFSLDI